MKIHKTNQRMIFKIHSSRLKRENWNIKLSIDDAIKNEELVPLADSQALRFIYQIHKKDVSEENELISLLRYELKDIKKEKFSEKNRKKIKSIYKKINNLLFVKDYITVEFQNKSHFDRACSKNGFFINNEKFVRIAGTPAGVKKRTIVFINEKIRDEFYSKMINGANPIEIIPAKLEAYRSLIFSSSTPVPNTKNILVVDDWETFFKSDIMKVGEDENGVLDAKIEKNAQMSLEDSDGYGVISPRLSRKWLYSLKEETYNENDEIKVSDTATAYVVRNSYCKGSLFTFDFHRFNSEISKKEYLTDVWGNSHKIDDIDIIMPVSMMKLWKAYKNLDDYLYNCEINGYSFSVTKCISDELENYRDMNYQFIQSLRLDDTQIKQLVQPTIDEIHDVIGGDYRKTLLFLRGCDLTEKNVWKKSEFDYVKALMINPKMIDDPFVIQSVHKMIKKRIKEAKTGVIRVKGNFTIIAGDVYGFMEHVFGVENPKGLLCADEFYNQYWNDRNINKIVAFRAPQTCHENTKIMNLKNTKNMRKWYKFMPYCTIFNAHDCTCHTLNGADKDGDTVLTTDNEIIMSGVEPLPPIVCNQNSVMKCIPTEKDLQDSNKKGFGEKIGAYTNKATTMEQMLCKFEKNSKEYNELQRRIRLCMHFQQCEIDRIKGVESPPMPKEWYDYKTNLPKEDDSIEELDRKEFNMKILANKKAKFMIYIYEDLMRDYKKFKDTANKKSLVLFGEELSELKPDTEIKKEFLSKVQNLCPVEECNSLMNKICNIFENEFDGIVSDRIQTSKFDCKFLIPDIDINKKTKSKIESEYKRYIKRVQLFFADKKIDNFSQDEIKDKRNQMLIEFRQICDIICPNSKELLKILVEMLYNTNKSKQFVWDIMGEEIINNLLKDNNYKISFPQRSDIGDIVYNHGNFFMNTIALKEV